MKSAVVALPWRCEEAQLRMIMKYTLSPTLAQGLQG